MLHWWTYLRTMGANFHEVVEGRLYRGATPEPKNLKKWHAKYNIRTWIDLRQPSDCGFGSPTPTDRTRLFAAQVRMCKELGIDHIRIPISDREPTEDYDITRCLRLMDKGTDDESVFVACQGGRHRAGQMVALFGQRFLGWNEKQVKDSLKEGGFYPNGHERFARALEKLLGFALLLLCLVVPASAQSTGGSSASYPDDYQGIRIGCCVNGTCDYHQRETLTIASSGTVDTFRWSELPAAWQPAPVFTTDPSRVIYDVTVVERPNPIRGALAGVRTLRPPKIRGDQLERRNPLLLQFRDASSEIPLKANDPGDRQIRTPVPISGHPWLKPDNGPVATQVNFEADNNTVRVELDALRKATARPKSVYGADPPSFDRSYWVPFGLAVASSCTDWHSTSGALDRGGREANPIFRTDRGLGVRYGANVAATAAFLGYTAWLEHQGHRRVARILLWTLTGLRVTASAWNYSLRR